MSQTSFNPRGVVKSVAQAKYLEEVKKLCGTFVQDDELTWLGSVVDQLKGQGKSRNRRPRMTLSEGHCLTRYSTDPMECYPAVAARHYMRLEVPAGSDIVRHADPNGATLVVTTPSGDTHTFKRRSKTWSVESRPAGIASGRSACMRFGGRGPSAESE